MALSNLDSRTDTVGAVRAQQGRNCDYPVAREVVSVTVADEGTNAETDVAINGRTTQIHFIVPTLDDVDTAELLVQDADDNTIYQSGELAEETSHVLDVHESLCGTITFRVECSAQQNDAARTFAIYVYYT